MMDSSEKFYTRKNIFVEWYIDPILLFPISLEILHAIFSSPYYGDSIDYCDFFSGLRLN